MKKTMKTTIASVVISANVLAGFSIASAVSEKEEIKSNRVTFFGSSTSTISNSVAIPASHGQLLFSGTVPPLLNKDGATTYERYGDTKTQAVGILKNLEAQLKAKGLSMKDITYLRVYVVSDPNKGGKPDYQGWFDAYGQFFNTEENPRKTARSTVGVESLVNSDWLIEIEAVASFKHTSRK
ncbi:RidA family protein [Domibacillus robiginosus]|uniref:RidA family protein n=1 Tax=Domibacillus robiginosus TaxID=1071054 RepID=UPI00067D13BE|nr:RidA family protein [Domibacillus robiginosus]